MYVVRLRSTSTTLPRSHVIVIMRMVVRVAMSVVVTFRPRGKLLGPRLQHICRHQTAAGEQSLERSLKVFVIRVLTDSIALPAGNFLDQACAKLIPAE